MENVPYAALPMERLGNPQLLYPIEITALWPGAP